MHNIHRKQVPYVAAAFVVAMGLPVTPLLAEPTAMVIVPLEQLPGKIAGVTQDLEPVHTDNVLTLYRDIRSVYGVSHTVMAEWLGVKRRTLYNWQKSPEKASQYGEQIENRLYQLDILRREIEPEHVAFVKKIAFSPIYGDPKFGKAILNGEDLASLISWYDKLFSEFESYRSVLKKNSLLS